MKAHVAINAYCTKYPFQVWHNGALKAKFQNASAAYWKAGQLNQVQIRKGLIC